MNNCTILFWKVLWVLWWQTGTFFYWYLKITLKIMKRFNCNLFFILFKYNLIIVHYKMNTNSLWILHKYNISTIFDGNINLIIFCCDLWAITQRHQRMGKTLTVCLFNSWNFDNESYLHENFKLILFWMTLAFIKS